MDVQPIVSAITPGLSYADAPAAIRWLVDVLGFRITSLYQEPDGHIHFSQLEWETGAIQVSSRSKQPRLPETGRSSIVLTAKDAKAVDAIYARAQAAGAKILLPIEDTFYGSHGFSVSDPEGNMWHLGTPWLKPGKVPELRRMGGGCSAASSSRSTVATADVDVRHHRGRIFPVQE